MSHNPNTVKSQDDLSTTNDGKRSSDVLLSAIDELEELRKENEAFEELATNLEKDCERLQKQLDIAQEALDYYSDMRKYNKSGWCSTDVGYKKAWEASLKIKELNK